MRELSDQLEGEALELVLLDQLVQVDGEKLKGDAGVGPTSNKSAIRFGQFWTTEYLGSGAGALFRQNFNRSRIFALSSGSSTSRYRTT